MNNRQPSTPSFNPVTRRFSCSESANAPARRSLTMVNPAPEKLDRLLRTREAAKVVGLSPRTMESYRRNGGGPPFVKIRDYAVRYVLRDLLAWITARKRTLTLDSDEDAIFAGKPDATKP